MKALQGLTNTLGYIAEGALEIFSPNHDSYPSAGIQPYSGEIYRPAKKSRYQGPIAKLNQS